MKLKRIKYCAAQNPILPWWEDVEGNEVKGGRENFWARYNDRNVIVLQFRELSLAFIDLLTLERVDIERKLGEDIWVEVEDESTN